MANYFITENYLKANTPITQNVDSKDIIPFVKPASDMFIQNYLGSYFYVNLLASYNAQTLNSNETTLVAIIQPIVAWRAAADAVYAMHYQLKNKGVQLQSGDQSSPAAQEEVVMLKRHYDQKAEFFEERLRKYLILNKDLFPDFTNKLNTDSCLTDMIPKEDSGYNQDMLMI